MSTTATTHDEALKEAVTSTFEFLAFMVADPGVSEAQMAAEFTAGCRVRFRGRVSGVLEAETHGDVLTELAGNMLALDTPPSPAEEISALCEVANVICGNVLPAMLGSQSVFDLSAPEARNEGVIRHRTGDDILAQTVIGMGEGRVEVVVRRYA
jgi:CheY-specific phosphatase CheX